MKYIVGISIMLMVNSEIFSLAILSVIALMFFGDILQEADRRGEIR